MFSFISILFLSKYNSWIGLISIIFVSFLIVLFFIMPIREYVLLLIVLYPVINKLRLFVMIDCYYFFYPVMLLPFQLLWFKIVKFSNKINFLKQKNLLLLILLLLLYINLLFHLEYVSINILTFYELFCYFGLFILLFNMKFSIEEINKIINYSIFVTIIIVITEFFIKYHFNFIQLILSYGLRNGDKSAVSAGFMEIQVYALWLVYLYAFKLLVLERISFFSIFIIILLVILSASRGAFLLFFIVTLYYYICNIKKTFLYWIIFILFLSFLLYFFSDKLFLVKRFSQAFNFSELYTFDLSKILKDSALFKINKSINYQFLFDKDLFHNIFGFGYYYIDQLLIRNSNYNYNIVILLLSPFFVFYELGIIFSIITFLLVLKVIKKAKNIIFFVIFFLIGLRLSGTPILVYLIPIHLKEINSFYNLEYYYLLTNGQFRLNYNEMFFYFFVFLGFVYSIDNFKQNFKGNKN
jgi:hypothetical protein